ncbi:MAG: phosphotransferase [Acidobacteriota bacterium]
MSAAIEDLASKLGTLGLRATSVEELSGDVSPRRYFRAALTGGARCIVALYPAEMRDVQERFVATTELLTQTGVRVPEILANATAEGIMAVEDFGGQALFQDGRYPGDEFVFAAAAIALRIASIPPETLEGLLPPLDGAQLQSELEQTWTMALEPNGLCRDQRLGQRLDQLLKAVCGRLDEANPWPSHRDFMARNLMVLPSGELGVLDHQDLRPAPAGYDLASLVSDSLICPNGPRAAVRASGRLKEAHFDRLVVQRTFKIVGTFFAFAARGAQRHLTLVPATINTGKEALFRLPEAELLDGLERELENALRAVSAAAASP